MRGKQSAEDRPLGFVVIGHGPILSEHTFASQR
jgi:hypothetical protein